MKESNESFLNVTDRALGFLVIPPKVANQLFMLKANWVANNALPILVHEVVLDATPRHVHHFFTR